MVKEAPEWNPTCERFVAFLDIMGFKDMVLNNPHEQIYEIFRSFQNAVKSVEETQVHQQKIKKNEDTATTQFRERLVKCPIKTVLFSDSILLVTNDNSAIAMLKIIACVGWIIQNAFFRKIPIKGAISCGKETADLDNYLHFGTPLIDAYELQKELLLYGVVLHHSAEKRLREFITQKEFSFNVVLYQTPLKSGTVTHCLVDWCPAEPIDPTIPNAIYGFYFNASGKPRIYIDNTLKYLKWLKKDKAKFEKKYKEKSV